jgi:hypothetical protein
MPLIRALYSKGIAVIRIIIDTEPLDHNPLLRFFNLK